MSKEFASQSFIGHLGEENYKKLVNFILRYLSEVDIPIKRYSPPFSFLRIVWSAYRGTFVEFRNGMINVSPLGRNASYVYLLIYRSNEFTMPKAYKNGTISKPTTKYTRCVQPLSNDLKRNLDPLAWHIRLAVKSRLTSFLPDGTRRFVYSMLKKKGSTRYISSAIRRIR